MNIPAITAKDRIAALLAQVEEIKGEAVQDLQNRINEKQAELDALKEEMRVLVGAPIRSAKPSAKPASAYKSPDTLSPDGMHAEILRILSEHPNGIARGQIGKILNISPWVLKPFMQKGISLKRWRSTGERAGTRYFLP